MAWLFNLDTVENWAYIDNVFSPEECNEIKRISLSKNKTESLIGPDGIIDYKIRKNNVVWINEKDKELHWMYKKLTDVATSLNEQFFKFDLVGFCEDIQFTEYQTPGDFYGEHIDKSYNNVIRKLSLSVQLTDPKEYEGCDLLIRTNNKSNITRRNQGTIIAFPSYIMHQVTPLIKGTRHSLVAWIGGNNFK
jgi:PKHD-type hydroxylase